MCWNLLVCSTISWEVESTTNQEPNDSWCLENKASAPSHLIIGGRVLSLQDAVPCHGDGDIETSPICPNNQMRHLCWTLDHFWKRWNTEYLLELRECHRYSGKGNKGSVLVSVGHIVLVHEGKQPRRLVKIETIMRGSGRQALVRVHSTGTRSKLLRRRLKCLYPLEVRCHNYQGNSEVNDGTVETSNPVRRSMRAAALTAKDGIKGAPAQK